MRFAGRWILQILPVTLAAGWGSLVLLYADIVPAQWRMAAAIAFCVAGLVAVLCLWRRRWRLPVVACFALALGGVIFGWQRITPSNTRDWQEDVAVLAHATIDGDRVTVHNIRDFRYRTASDFEPRYYDHTYDLRELVGIDLYTVYWMGPAIAHVMLSFGFADGSQLAVSIETRKERGEDYSTLLGFFRHYELYYVVADERDVVQLRTTYRDPPEDVYLYRLQAPIENGRRLFLEYMNHINALATAPAFYNTLTDNCATGAWINTRVNPGRPPLSWKLLASGYAAEYLYELGRMDQSLPFAELQTRSHINARARAAEGRADFSRMIREDLPLISK